MNNTVHIDEKWFYITKDAHRFYLTPGEADPHRTCRSKSFITKVMFMCVACRPQFAEDGSVLLDEKIGIFPFTQQVPTQRNSKNRPSGTLETKPIQLVTKDVIKACFINKILPAIRYKWPANVSKLMFIQQDNTKPHIQDTYPEFRVATTEDGFDIRIVHQPPNSPDKNVNDLGWFRAIQTESACYNVDQLVNAVEEPYAQQSPQTLNKVFLSLQSCMLEIMKQRGHNAYKIPHMKKYTLIRVDQLSTDLKVPLSLVEECMAYMLENASMPCVEGLMEQLEYLFYQQGLTNQFLQLGI